MLFRSTAPSVTPPAPGGWAWEAWEARAIEVTGVVSGTPRDLAGGSRSLVLRLPGGGELLVGVAPEVLVGIPSGTLVGKRAVTVRGVLHQRAGAAGGGYRLWALVVAVSSTTTGPTEPSVVTGGQPTAGAASPVPLLTVGTPSIAAPGEPPAWWVPRVAGALSVRGGSLALAGPAGVELVVLPVCVEAQAVPARIRAGGMVDRAGRAAYPQSW